MSDTWKKAKIWTKLVLIGLVVLFVLVFVIENYSLSVQVWLGHMHTMSVLELLIATFLAGVVTTLLARPIYRTLRQIGELRKPATSDAPIPLAPSPPPPPPPAPVVPIENSESVKPTP